MKLLDSLEEPNWNLLELAQEQLEESQTRDAVIQVIRTTARLDGDQGVRHAAATIVREDLPGPLRQNHLGQRAGRGQGWPSSIGLQ